MKDNFIDFIGISTSVFDKQSTFLYFNGSLCFLNAKNKHVDAKIYSRDDDDDADDNFIFTRRAFRACKMKSRKRKK